MKSNLLFIAGLMLFTVGCAPRVTVDQSKNADLSNYRTFAFMNNDSSVVAGGNPLYYNQIATQNVESTMRDEFAKKGVTEAAQNPDLLVGYHFFVQKKTQNVPVGGGYSGLGGYSGYGSGFGRGWGWGRWGYGGWGPGWGGFGGTQYIKQNYEAGTVVVDLVDAKTHKLVWRGSVQDAVNNPANITTQLAQEVGQILNKFPDRKTS